MVKPFYELQEDMSTNIDRKLSAIIDEYVKDYIIKSNDESFVNGEKSNIIYGSFPIIWFGDLEKYLSTNDKKKVVTVAINPSNLEFEQKRFDEIDLSNYNALSEEEKEKKRQNLANTLNNYFHVNPYMEWFRSYNNVLNLINADYKNDEDRDYVVLHVDIYSAIATKPVWSKLNKEQKNKLQNSTLFEKLIDYLKPDIVFYSSDKGRFPILVKALNMVGCCDEEDSFIFNKEYYIGESICENGLEKCWISINYDSKRIHNKNYLRIYKSTKNTRIIFWGANISKPFTVFNLDVKKTIFEAWLKNQEIPDDLSYYR